MSYLPIRGKINKSPIIYITTNLSIRIYHDAYCLAKKIKIKKKEEEHK
jgi:hypothetical protein